MRNQAKKTYNNFSFKAFTLAEVLITLGIIGVVASLTIPTLISNYQKEQTVTQLKKNYTAISQAIKQSEIENGSNKYWVWSKDEIAPELAFDTYFKPYMKVLKYCSHYSHCGYSKLLPWVGLSGEEYQVGVSDTSSRVSTILQDGTFLLVMFKTSTKTLYLDVNGAKPPNKVGIDLFVFEIDSSKGLVPAGNGNGCKVIYVGSDCAVKIMRDGWQIKDDYPWN